MDGNEDRLTLVGQTLEIANNCHGSLGVKSRCGFIGEQYFRSGDELDGNLRIYFSIMLRRASSRMAVTYRDALCYFNSEAGICIAN